MTAYRDKLGGRREEADAILFPGQGSQHGDMREAVARADPELLKRAIATVGVDPFERLADGTRFVQPAIFCASVVSWRSIRERTRPIAFAGHSLGEYAALVAAEAVDPLDALRLVALRGRLTQQAAAATGGGMLALLGVDAHIAQAIAERCGVAVANDNSPGQIVLSGGHRGLADAAHEVRGLGKASRMLDVQGPFHSPMMSAAVEPFSEALEQVAFVSPRTPVYSCVTARPFDDIPRRLAESLVCGVRWREVLQRLDAAGATRFVEVGPGKVLSGLVKRTIRGAERIAAEEQAIGAST